MRLGVEVLAKEPTELHLGNFFESWLALPTGTIKRSLGRDEYHLTLKIRPGLRLAATGRTFICQIDAEEAGVGQNQARLPILTLAAIPAGEPLCLGLRTNVFLDLKALTAGVWFRLQRGDGHGIAFDLNDYRVLPEQMAPGRYLIDLTELL